VIDKVRGAARVLPLLSLVAAVSTAAFAADPAPGTHRVAFLSSGPAAANVENFAAFKQGLAENGYVEGRNLVLDVRWANGNVASLPNLVNEALDAKPKVIISTGGAVTIDAVKAATTSVPVIFISGDPVAEKIVSNLARPGGNLTGFAVLAGDLEAKRLEVLRELLPRAKRIAIIWNPTQVSIEPIIQAVEVAAKQLDFTLVPWKARNPSELDAAFAEIAKAKADALFVVADPVLGFERARIVAFAKKNQLPAIYFWREFVEIGGLASYGTSLSDVYRRIGGYVDKILKGQKPGDLPIQQPTTFELVVNRDTARELGLTIPLSVLQRADKVLPP
jgi:putative ABC transport system substrate-binding protein